MAYLGPPPAYQNLSGQIEITPTGGIGANTLQGALNELDSDKAAKAANLSDIHANTALTNLGATSAGSDMLKAATLEAQRNLLDMEGQIISVGSVTSAATMTVTLPTGYSIFNIKLYNILPVTNSVAFVALISTDGGSTFFNSNGNYNWSQVYATNSAVGFYSSTSGGSNFIDLLCGQALNTAANSASIDANIFPDANGGSPHIMFNSCRIGSSGVMLTVNGSGYYGGTSRWTHIRFLFGSGNISKANYVLTGKRLT
jgi:hypothetical protein